MFKRILIANRGEIARRISRAAREMGIETVSVYHKVDRESPYVCYADYAFEIFAETPKNAYLDIQQLIDVARKNGCEAIHPGYGFLSERAEFSQHCIDSDIKFIGPSAEAIDVMGNKTKARELMANAGVPIVPGTHEPLTSVKEGIVIAKDMGFPVLLKAAAGGGGKGMRLIKSESEFLPEFEAAQREALKAFGDDSVYIEKFIVNPKHIEIQIIADEHGNYVHLGERDCSIQRRHQKVVEEAPSTVLTEELRAKMGQVAIEAAKACNYYNAGTIEFLLDKDKNFYFLEMNTRLQVEHPVTELVTGFDLAKEQIRIAYGLPLSFSQQDVQIRGYAIECRIYAEDPFNGFLPDTGKIQLLREPGGKGIRVDSGIETGSEITIHFDPMLSKLIAWGNTREEALNRMDRALQNYKVKGLRTIIPFLLALVRNPVFRDGYFDTGFIENTFDFDKLNKMKQNYEEVIAAIVGYAYQESKKQNKISLNGKPGESNQKTRKSRWGSRSVSDI